MPFLIPIALLFSTCSLWLGSTYAAREIKKMESKPPDLMELVPIVAAIFASLAMLLFPHTKSFSWLPLTFSSSSVVNILYALWWAIHFKKWPWDTSITSIKSVLDRLLQGKE
jgi:hypothetical protein